MYYKATIEKMLKIRQITTPSDTISNEQRETIVFEMDIATETADFASEELARAWVAKQLERGL